MTKFWWSGEIQADVADSYREAMKAVDVELNRLLEGVSLEGKVEQWAFIAIIRNEDSPNYAEIATKTSSGKVLEFRLMIPHAEFLVSSPRQKISLIFKALSRSVLMMEGLGVPTDTRRTLQAILSQTFFLWKFQTFANRNHGLRFRPASVGKVRVNRGSCDADLTREPFNRDFSTL